MIYPSGFHSNLQRSCKTCSIPSTQSDTTKSLHQKSLRKSSERSTTRIRDKLTCRDSTNA